MQIVKYYTGNPLLNNALMTVKALAGLSSISELTTEILKGKIMKVHEELPYSLISLNLRFKSYTMLFSRNSLLYNGKLGKQIYQCLMLKIVDGFKNKGDKVCDISGLRYEKSFSQLYSEVLNDCGVSEKKDLTLNRCWFPLLGGLGSDAQALPMAKYTYNVHPIFIVILQFLPLSAFIYKKGLLLVDSSNTVFCENYIQGNVEEVIMVAKDISTGLSIENIKLDTQGHYIVKALNMMLAADMDFKCSEFNLWSFSNSKAGSCVIDRIPNKLLLKLEALYVKHKNELTNILHNSIHGNDFLNCLDSNNEWLGLYPAKNYEGVSVELFESYWGVIGQKKETEIAKYIAYLISKYKSGNFEKYLGKTDAYDCKIYNYKDELNKVLLQATQKGEWSFNHQLYIQDYKEDIPVWFASYSLYKLIHYYYQKGIYNTELPIIVTPDNNQARLCRWIISLISREDMKYQNDMKDRILHGEDSDNSIFDELLIRGCCDRNVSIYTVFPLLYNEEGRKNVWGLKSLLRYYYTSSELFLDGDLCIFPKMVISNDYQQWFESIDSFVMAYLRYRIEKIVNHEKEGEYVKKIFKSIPKEDLRKQRIWFRDILDRLNDYGKEGTWDEDLLVYDPMGNYNFSTFIYAVRMKFSKVVYEYSKVKTEN
ncbi:MAG: hypothetical protein PARBA_03084 [Parabacteroides sp.]